MLPKLSVAFGLTASFGVDILGDGNCAVGVATSVGSTLGISAINSFSAGLLVEMTSSAFNSLFFLPLRHPERYF
jgi:hypothetical protein